LEAEQGLSKEACPKYGSFSEAVYPKDKDTKRNLLGFLWRVQSVRSKK
jgi:hypothetical protein